MVSKVVKKVKQVAVCNQLFAYMSFIKKNIRADREEVKGHSHFPSSFHILLQLAGFTELNEMKLEFLHMF